MLMKASAFTLRFSIPINKIYPQLDPENGIKTRNPLQSYQARQQKFQPQGHALADPVR
jgi:hypothetical protein